jgi:signal transduction histidine kinase
MVHRAVRNLVENALNHTPAETDVEVDVGGDATVSVLDHGSGIAPADRERIFERFWRGSGKKSGGAGLGLSIVKRIVETHGGSLTVKERPAGGTAFTLKFVGASATSLS